MSRYKDERLVNKVDELAASLHATSEVLTTADHMLEQYRDMNKEQDAEIARLHGELRMSKKPRASRRPRGRSLPRTPSVSDFEEKFDRPGKVRFTDDDSQSEVDEFESALHDLSRKQSRLERELKKNRQKGSEELKDLAEALKKDSDESSLERKLDRLQRQLEEDKFKKIRRDDSVEKLADEIREVKGLVQSRNQRDNLGSRQDTLSSRSFVGDVKDMTSQEQQTISSLQRQLQQRDGDQERLLSQLRRTKGQLEESDANQRQLAQRLEGLEGKFERQKFEKRNVEEEFDAFRNEAKKTNLMNAEYLRDQTRQDPRLSDLQRKLDNLEREKEAAVDRWSSCKRESEKKDLLVDKMTSQIRELAGNVDRVEMDKKRCLAELEDSMRKLKDYKSNEEDMKKMLRKTEEELRESEEQRIELKNRALEAIKDYRSRYREIEREKAYLEEREDSQQKELAKIKLERREMELGSKRTEKEVEFSENKIKELENNVQMQQSQLSQLMYEKLQLEEELAKSTSAKQDANQLQQDLQDARAKNAAVNGQLADESSKRRVLEERVSEMQENLMTAKDEASNLYQQLNEERTAHAKAMRRMEEELKTVSMNEDRTLQELMDKANQEKMRYEDEILTLKSQMMDERAALKASQLSQNEDESKIKRLSVELERVVEENRRIRKKYQQMRKDNDVKLSKSEDNVQQNKERISELEDELRNNQENLLQTRESFMESFKDIHSSVDSLLDALMQEANQTQPIKSLSEATPLDPKKWSSEIMDKIHKCDGILRLLGEKSSKQKSQLSKAQEKIKEMFTSSEKDKNYFIGELENQKVAINTLIDEKKSWEKSKKEKNTKIRNLQDKLNDATKHLEQCAKVLHSTLTIMEEKKNFLEDLDFLKDEHLEKERIHEKYIRHTEQLGSIRDRLEDARIALQDVQEENMDNTMFSLKFLKSLSPAPKRRLDDKKNRTRKKQQQLDYGSAFDEVHFNLTTSEDDRPPSKKSKELLPMLMSDREFNDSFVPRRE